MPAFPTMPTGRAPDRLTTGTLGPAATIRLPMLAQLRAQLGVVVLDARHLHPTTAERRIEARSAEELPPEALCTHHFVPGLVETSHP